VDDDIPYLLLTPGPLTTTRTVRQSMLKDWCTWDAEYNNLTNDIRRRLVTIATTEPGYTSVLMQGSGTFSVEATLGSVIPPDGKALLVDNGAYGARIVKIANRLGINNVVCKFPETQQADPEVIDKLLAADPAITHLAMVHCETTTGGLNPVDATGQLTRKHGTIFILDAMSSFAGMPIDVAAMGADYLISSANKCMQGVPGFGFVIARQSHLESTQGWARSLCLDLFDQWQEMESKGGKWRYTSPTHVVRAFLQAMSELESEGGVSARHKRYCENRDTLVSGMRSLGIQTLLNDELLSPFITTFLCPSDPAFSFDTFYQALKRRRFVIYPGKVTAADTFRVGTIGNAFPDDFRQLIGAVKESLDKLGIHIPHNTLNSPH